MGRAGSGVIAVGVALLIVGYVVSGVGFLRWLGVGLIAVGAAMIAVLIVFSPKSERSKTASPEP